MPYIKQSSREALRESLVNLVYDAKASAQGNPGTQEGIANYRISKFLLEYFKPSRYADYNAMIGVLECAKLELYRVQVSEYENEKKAENGPIHKERMIN